MAREWAGICEKGTDEHKAAFEPGAGVMTTPAWDRGDRVSATILSPRHEQLLADSAISSEVAAERGYQTVNDPKLLEDCGFATYQRRLLPGLLIPLHGVDGQVRLYQYRPDQPRTSKGKAVKYETPTGQRLMLVSHPRVIEHLGDPSRPLIFTEGVRKQDAAISAGHDAVALIGVYGFRASNDFGGSTVLSDFEAVALKARKCHVVYDSDTATNPNVSNAAVRLAEYLQSKGAEVKVVVPQAGPDGSKVGLDDYLAAHGDLAVLLDTGLTPGHARALFDKRPRVDISDPPLEMKESALEALGVRNDPPVVFARGNELVRVAHDEHGHRIELFDRPKLRHRLEEVACWERGTRAGSLEVPPPQHVTDDLLVHGDLSKRFPIVEAVLTSPTFAPDGTLVATDGYNAAARVFVDLGDLEIAERPSVAEAKRLLFDDLLGDFPFVADVENKERDKNDADVPQADKVSADRANALALLLLPLVRPLISGTTPLHHIGSPEPGTGKGLLTDMLLVCVNGESAAKFAPATDDAEWRKRLTAALVEGRQVVIIDNIVQKLDSPSLASVLTSATYQDRVLGHTRLVTLPNRAIWICTGNNVTMSAEIARRCVNIRLDSNVERPWTRDGFRHPDLRGWAKENRGRIVAAGIALVQAWLDAGRPLPSIAFGDYGNWASVMGGILANAGVEGFLENADQRFDEMDAEREQLEAFVSAWWVAHGEIPKTAKELVGTPNLLSSLDFAYDWSSPSAKLGYFLRQHRDRVVDKKKIVAAGKDRTKAITWKLEPVTQRGSSPADASTKAQLDDSAAGDAGDVYVDSPVDVSDLYSVAGTTGGITRVTREPDLSSTFAAGDGFLGRADPAVAAVDTCLVCGALLTADSYLLDRDLGRVASKLVADYCIECALIS